MRLYYEFIYVKYLHHINKNTKTFPKDLSEHFNLDLEDSQNILKMLEDKGYIVYKKPFYYPTFESKHLIKSIVLDWLYHNLLAILALIVAIIALFV